MTAYVGDICMHASHKSTTPAMRFSLIAAVSLRSTSLSMGDMESLRRGASSSAHCRDNNRIDIVNKMDEVGKHSGSLELLLLTWVMGRYCRE